MAKVLAVHADGILPALSFFPGRHANLPITRYEVVIAIQRAALQRMTEDLDLPFNAAALDLVTLFPLSGDSGRSSKEIAPSRAGRSPRPSGGAWRPPPAITAWPSAWTILWSQAEAPRVSAQGQQAFDAGIGDALAFALDGVGVGETLGKPIGRLAPGLCHRMSGSKLMTSRATASADMPKLLIMAAAGTSWRALCSGLA